MARFESVEWLASWLLEKEAFEFDWDKGNATKSLTKHGVTTQEVEEVFLGRLAVPLGTQVSPMVDEERLAVVGSTWAGHLLTVVFTLRSGKIRAISSRPAHKKERRIYEKIRKVTQRI